MSDKVVPIREVPLKERVLALEGRVNHLCEALNKLGIYEEPQPEPGGPPEEQTEPEE